MTLHSRSGPRHGKPVDHVSDQSALILRASTRVNFGAQPFPNYNEDEQLIIELTREVRRLNALLESAAQEETLQHLNRQRRMTDPGLNKLNVRDRHVLIRALEQAEHRNALRIKTQADEAINAEAAPRIPESEWNKYDYLFDPTRTSAKDPERPDVTPVKRIVNGQLTARPADEKPLAFKFGPNVVLHVSTGHLPAVSDSGFWRRVREVREDANIYFRVSDEHIARTVREAYNRQIRDSN